MIESQIVARVLPSKCREAVKVLLQEVYGYEDFRNLEVYDDLFRGKEKLQLSQGQLIEEVIMEAEKGIKGDSSAHNLLLTAPTGAGKSLLFQLPAIYLGNDRETTLGVGQRKRYQIPPELRQVPCLVLWF